MKATLSLLFCFCKCHVSNTERVPCRGEAAKKGGICRMLQAPGQIHELWQYLLDLAMRLQPISLVSSWNFETLKSPRQINRQV